MGRKSERPECQAVMMFDQLHCFHKLEINPLSLSLCQKFSQNFCDKNVLPLPLSPFSLTHQKFFPSQPSSFSQMINESLIFLSTYLPTSTMSTILPFPSHSCHSCQTIITWHRNQEEDMMILEDENEVLEGREGLEGGREGGNKKTSLASGWFHITTILIFLPVLLSSSSPYHTCLHLSITVLYLRSNKRYLIELPSLKSKLTKSSPSKQRQWFPLTTQTRSGSLIQSKQNWSAKDE